jgi:hypothetical protein
LFWRSPRGRSIVDKVVKFARGLPQSVNYAVSLIVSHFQLLTGGFPFLLGGVRFQVLITTTLIITDVPKNMAVLRKRIDWAAVLGEGLDRYGKRSLSGLHH